MTMIMLEINNWNLDPQRQNSGTRLVGSVGGFKRVPHETVEYSPKHDGILQLTLIQVSDEIQRTERPSEEMMG